MFESVTKRRKNPFINAFGWFLLITVCVVFVFIGFSPDSSLLVQGGTAAEVNGEAISLREFKELVDRLEADSKTSGKQDREDKQETAINILVSRSLIVQEAEKLNIHVSDGRVRQELLDIKPFYEEGVFSRLKYKTYLRQVKLTEAQFERKIRQDLIIQKMSRFIGFGATDLKIMDKWDDQIDQAQINVAYVKLSKQPKKGKRLEEVKALLRGQKYKALESYLQEKRIRWVNTGFFQITKDQIPGVGQNEEFLTMALGLGPEKKYGSHLVYQGDTAYLLKYQGTKMNATTKKNPQMDFFRQLMKRQKMNMVVQNWANSLKKKASIKINPDLF